MPKIDKSTLKVLERTKIRIYKFENKHTYFCSFYIGKGFKNYPSNHFQKTCKTKNINEAISTATKYYKEWFQKNPSGVCEKQSSFETILAQPYINYRIQKYKNKTHLKNNEQGERDKAKWNYMEELFEDVDCNDLQSVEYVINNDLLNKLKADGLKGNTINKYLSLIVQMYKRGMTKGVVNFIPDVPTQEVFNNPRWAYENFELNLINERMRQEYKKTNEIYFLELKDYCNLLRSAGFRPGLEPLMLRRKDFEIISDNQNPNEKFLKFTVYKTKVTKPHHPIANNWFFENIWDEVVNRHKGLGENDFLLFPNIKDRNRLKNKTGKDFVQFSKDCNLYFYKGGTRPIYVIRHTYATEQYKRGTSIEDISQLMNTSVRMIQNVYLAHTNSSLVNLAKRRGDLTQNKKLVIR